MSGYDDQRIPIDLLPASIGWEPCPAHREHPTRRDLHANPDACGHPECDAITGRAERLQSYLREALADFEGVHTGCGRSHARPRLRFQAELGREDRKSTR